MNLRKDLCMESFINSIFLIFSKIPEIANKESRSTSALDCIMSCFAVFSLKWPSLLQYELSRHNPEILKNLRNLFLIKNPPSDTYMRESLDVLDPYSIRPAFKKIFALLQRGKIIEKFRFLDGFHLVSIDGTGHFSSTKVHCKNCCVKNHSDGRKTYYHQMLSAVMVHPNQSKVIPLCPEPIVNHIDSNKNDCEQIATRRLLDHLRREHPHLKICVVQDALNDNGVNVKQLKNLSMEYIIVRKGDPLSLVDQYGIVEHQVLEDGVIHHYRFFNNHSLNLSHKDTKTNILEHKYTTKKGVQKRACWITSFEITKSNVHNLMKGGRSRWKIENETFNTLKNQGYNFEHNFGHGKNNLCTVMDFLLFLAFLIDQAQELSCPLYQKAREFCRTFYGLWERMRAVFLMFTWSSWEQCLSLVAGRRHESSA